MDVLVVLAVIIVLAGGVLVELLRERLWRRRARVRFVFDPPQETKTMKITTIQKFTVRALFEDAQGNQVEVDGFPTWEVSDPAIASVEVDQDGLSATVYAAAPGIATVFVTADADTGESVNTVTGSFEVEVVEDTTVRVAFVFGEPEPKGTPDKA